MSQFGTVGPIDPDTGRFKGVPEPDVTLEMERAGQQALVGSELLPVEILPNYLEESERLQTAEEAQAEVEALGIELHPISDDPLFRRALLPPGWRKDADEHSMWSYVLDEQGRERIAVFFKAAPYDRRAHMRVLKVER